MELSEVKNVLLTANEDYETFCDWLAYFFVNQGEFGQ
jgi:hypothetical protein